MLFEGGLGQLKIDPIHLKLREHAKPYHAKMFGILRAYQGATKRERDHFVCTGVLKQVCEASWAAGTFIQPKKAGNIQVLTDFCKLNKYLVRKPFLLLKIVDILQSLEGFQ
jgi:hypothetical protein